MGKKPKAKPWLHPLDDPKLDKELYLSVDRTDPRATAELNEIANLPETCTKGHPWLEQDQTRTQSEHWKFGGNCSARWIECRGCGIRLAYWPSKGHSGKHRAQTHPQVIHEAFLRLSKYSKLQINRDLVQKTIKHVESENRLNEAARNQNPEPTPPSKAAGSTEEVLTDSSEEDEEDRRHRLHHGLPDGIIHQRPRSILSAGKSSSATAMEAEGTAGWEMKQMEAHARALQKQVEELQATLLKKSRPSRTRSKSKESRPRTPTGVRSVQFVKSTAEPPDDPTEPEENPTTDGSWEGVAPVESSAACSK